MNRRWLMSSVVLMIPALVACGQTERVEAPASDASTTTAPPNHSGPRHTTQETVVAGAPREAEVIVAVLTARLRAAGAHDPEVELGPISSGVGSRSGETQQLEIAWTGSQGEDQNGKFLGSFLLGPGRLSLRTAVSERPGQCSGSMTLLEPGEPAEVELGDSPGSTTTTVTPLPSRPLRCVQLAPAFLVDPTVEGAVASAGSEPATSTIRLTLSRTATEILRARATERVFAAVDGFDLGEVRIDPPTVTVTDRFDGGLVEARAFAAKVVHPLPGAGLSFVSTVTD